MLKFGNFRLFIEAGLGLVGVRKFDVGVVAVVITGAKLSVDLLREWWDDWVRWSGRASSLCPLGVRGWEWLRLLGVVVGVDVAWETSCAMTWNFKF